MSTNQIISKIWSFCNTLRDDGVECGDEQKLIIHEIDSHLNVGDKIKETIKDILKHSEALW
jgi:hypothetical protein